LIVLFIIASFNIIYTYIVLVIKVTCVYMLITYL